MTTETKAGIAGWFILVYLISMLIFLGWAIVSVAYEMGKTEGIINYHAVTNIVTNITYSPNK